jgi:hypothetical protein
MHWLCSCTKTTLVGTISWKENIWYDTIIKLIFLNKKNFIRLPPVVSLSTANYAEELTKLVDKILILCEVAALSRKIEGELAKPNALQRSLSVSQYGITREEFDGMLIESDDEGSSSSKHTKGVKRVIDYQGGLIVDPSHNDLRRVRLDQAQRAKIVELLGAWYVFRTINVCYSFT